MAKYPDHTQNLVALRRIEGQVRGIQRMIEEGKYCVDILNQLHAAICALAKVEDKVLEKHFEGCISSALKGCSVREKKRKMQEMLLLLNQFRRV